MRHYILNRYSALAIAIQLVACVWILVGGFTLSSAGDRYFELLFYLYLPTIYLASTLLKLKGESGMFAGLLYGVACGIMLYGLLFGLVASLWMSRRLEPGK